MNYKVIAMLSVALAFLPVTTQAQERVLLEPLTKSEEADARAKNDYFIRKYTFAAMRHRLVKVNVELLETEGQIVIPLFDDEKIIANSTSIRIDEAAGVLRWNGLLVQNNLTEEAILDQVGIVETARAILETFTKVTISATFFERDEKSGANFTPVVTLAEALSPDQPNRYAQRSAKADFVRGASADLRTLERPALYRLQMLGMGGPYHILYEVDEVKMREMNSDSDLVGADDQGGVTETAAERQEKEKRRQEIEEFENSLGDNPHDAIYREKMREKGMQN